VFTACENHGGTDPGSAQLGECVEWVSVAGHTGENTIIVEAVKNYFIFILRVRASPEGGRGGSRYTVLADTVVGLGNELVVIRCLDHVDSASLASMPSYLLANAVDIVNSLDHSRESHFGLKRSF